MVRKTKQQITIHIDLNSFSPCKETSDDDNDEKKKYVSSSSTSLVFALFDLEKNPWEGRFFPRRDDDGTTTNLSSSSSSEDSWLNGIRARFESRYVFDCCFIVLLILFCTSTMVVDLVPHLHHGGGKRASKYWRDILVTQQHQSQLPS